MDIDCLMYSTNDNVFTNKRILAENLEASRSKLHLPDDFWFQQDNDPKHKSKYVMEYFATNQIGVISWPSQSPDMNPIEHLWDFIKKEVRKVGPKSVAELRLVVSNIWVAIPSTLCETLVNSMPSRVEALGRARGGPTPY